MNTIKIKDSESKLDYLKRAMRYCRNEYNKIRLEERCHSSHSAVKAMMKTQEKFEDLKTFGTEGFCWSYTSGLTYLNTGDTYELTICFRSDTERFFISSYGDFVERNPKLTGE